jgi:hypothetical protein
MPEKIFESIPVFFGRIKGIPIFALPKTSRVRLRARTPPFHGGDTGSNPVRGTTKSRSKSDFLHLKKRVHNRTAQIYLAQRVI